MEQKEEFTLNPFMKADPSARTNSIDFTCFTGERAHSQTETVLCPPTLIDSTYPKNTAALVGNYRFSNATNPVFIIVSADERTTVAARFFCTSLKHFMAWSAESTKLLVASQDFGAHQLPRYTECPQLWSTEVERCINASLEYFDSNPTLGFAATPVSVIYADCHSRGSFHAFHAKLPSDRSFLIRHFWFGEDWHTEHMEDCGYVSISLAAKALRASRCRGSVVCSRFTSLLTNLMPTLHQIYVHEPLDGNPNDTLSFFTPIFFTRHGQSEYNLEDRLGGDPDLTESGRCDAADIASFFKNEVLTNPRLFKKRTKKWDETVGFEVWCSQLRRTRHTAEPSSIVLTQGQIRSFKSLNEIHAGICEDMTNEEVKQIYPHIQSFRHTDKVGFRYPNGESYQDLARRLTPLLMELVNSKPCVLVVAHQAVLRTLLSYFGGLPVEKAVHSSCPQRTIWVCTYNRLGEPRLAEISLPPRKKREDSEKANVAWSGW